MYTSTELEINQATLSVDRQKNSSQNPSKPQYVESAYGQFSEILIRNGFISMPTFGGKTPARYGGRINVNNIAQHSDPQSPVYKYIFQERKRPPQLGDLFGYRISGWQTYTHEKLKSPDYLEKYNQKWGISHLEEYNQWRAISGAGVCILTGESAGNLFAFDIDWLDDELTEEARLVIEDILGGYGDIVMRRGNKGLCAFFRLEDGFYLGKDLDCSAGKIDLLYNGKQSVIPPSIHPQSDKPYVWLTERTLFDTTVDQLPIVTEELWFELMAALEQIVGPISGKEKRSAPAQSFDHRMFEDSFDRWVATEALKVADNWIHELGLTRLERLSDDFWVSVPSFRSSSTHRPDSQRTQNLHFTPKLIVDRGGKFRHWSLDRLVAECLGLSIDEAWEWLWERIPALKLPDWEPAPTPVIPPAAIIPAKTTTLAAAAAEVDSIVENKVLTSSKLNTEINGEIRSLLNEYEAAPSADKASIEKAIKEKVSQLPKGIIIKAQTGVGKTKAIKQYMFDHASVQRKDTTAMYFPTNALASENIETLAPNAAGKTGLYHPADDAFINEQGDEQRYCVHPSLDTAKKMGISVETLCKSGGGDGERCPHFDNCPFRKNNEFLKKKDHHMMASHAVALTPCSHRTGKFNTAVFDEEILSAAMSERVMVKSKLIAAENLATAPEITTEERLNYDNFSNVLVDLNDAVYLTQEDAGCFAEDEDNRPKHEIPLNIALVKSSAVNISMAKGYAVSERLRIQGEAIKEGFKNAGKKINQVSRLDKIIKVLDDLAIAKNDGIELSGRILIDPENGDINLYSMSRVDQGLLSKAYPVILDATAPDAEMYDELFDYTIKLDKGKYIKVKREFEVIEHTPVDRAESLKVVQVVGAPVSSTKLGLRRVGSEKNPSEGKHNREGMRAVIDMLTEGLEGESMLICHNKYNEWMINNDCGHAGFLSMGSLAGTNRHEHDKVGIIVGYTRLAPEEPFNHVGQITGRYCADRTSKKVERSIQLSDGTVKTAQGYQVIDSRVEAYTQYRLQRDFIQGVGRLRPLAEKGHEQTVFVLTDEDTGVLMDDQIHWSELHKPAVERWEDKEITEALAKHPISLSWRINQGFGLKAPAIIASKLERHISRELLRVALMKYPYIDTTKGQTARATLNKFDIMSVEGGDPSEVYFTSEQDLQYYITEHNLPYRIIKSVGWSADLVALTAGDIKKQCGVGGMKAKQLSKQLSAEIPSSHTVVEFKTLVDGVAPRGKWRRAAVRIGVDPVEALEGVFQSTRVVLRVK